MKHIELTVTQKEYLNLMNNAKEEGKTLNDYIRSKLNLTIDRNEKYEELLKVLLERIEKLDVGISFSIPIIMFDKWQDKHLDAQTKSILGRQFYVLAKGGKIPVDVTSKKQNVQFYIKNNKKC